MKTLGFVPVLMFSVGLAAFAPGCSSDSDEDSQDDLAISRVPGQGELPWEVVSSKGETYLPNVFYAEATETEQIMPLTIKGRYQIDRLVYPTIGNPNMYVRGDEKDEMMTVLRLEPELLTHLRVDQSTKIQNSSLRAVTLQTTDTDDLAVYLVSRSAREGKNDGPVAGTTPLAADGKTIFRIVPSSIVANPITQDTPEPFRKRQTFRLIFSRDAMKNVPVGLYDIRYEIKRGGKLIENEAAITRTGVNPKSYEYQFNAVRVFESVGDTYNVLNMTDTQISFGKTAVSNQTAFDNKTYPHLVELVNFLNTTNAADVRNSAFITFNGDLHNGGSPEVLFPESVANTYNREADAILEAIKQLKTPLFLTAGNHDGYVVIGASPEKGFFEGFADFIKGGPVKNRLEVINEAEPKAWPNFDVNAYSQYLTDTKATPGGRHVDIYTGQFVRRADAQTFEKGWIPVAANKRNQPLYDGFNQWQRTYGPLYYSHAFGKNQYVSINSYELRQHRRSGWGMYTVNYGGNVSQVQAEWMRRTIKDGQAASRDVIVFSHHDPRGGHKGKDFPYYFKHIEFQGMGDSAKNYIEGEILNPKLCKLIPSFAQSVERELGCLHDGLQEWMRADEEFDCVDHSTVNGKEVQIRKADGTCDTSLYDQKGFERLHPYYSGYAMLDSLLQASQMRTFLLGHTHYNSYEVLQSGDALVPGELIVDAEATKRYEAYEAGNPARARSFFEKLFRKNDPNAAYDPEALARQGVTVDPERGVFKLMLERAGHNFERTIAFNGNASNKISRELVIMRLTTAVDLTSQKQDGKPMYGFATMTVKPKKGDGRQYDLPQINQVTFYRNDIGASGSFVKVKEVELDRTKRVSPTGADNPVGVLFKGLE